MMQEITGAWNLPAASPERQAGDKPEVALAEPPATVVLQPETSSWLARMPALLNSLLETLGGLALALVLVVFMLLKREDLRNRLIRLVSHGQITVMTKALAQSRDVTRSRQAVAEACWFNLVDSARSSRGSTQNTAVRVWNRRNSRCESPRKRVPDTAHGANLAVAAIVAPRLWQASSIPSL